MTYEAPFVKVTAEGVFGPSSSAPVEIWRCGFHVSTITGGNYSNTALDKLCQDVFTPLSVYHAKTTTNAGTHTWLVSTSAAVIGEDGNYLGGGVQTTRRYTPGTATAGSGTAIHPLPTSVCITLRSIVARGPASHGRLYWPALATSISGTEDGRLTPAQATARVADMKILFDAINASFAGSIGTGHAVTLESQVGTGVSAPVIRVGCGRKLDAIENREGEFLEEHAYATLAVGSTLSEVVEDQWAPFWRNLREDRQPQS